MLLLHGIFGWDEAVIAVAAFGVLWLAVKLAGRNSPQRWRGGRGARD